MFGIFKKTIFKSTAKDYATVAYELAKIFEKLLKNRTKDQAAESNIIMFDVDDDNYLVRIYWYDEKKAVEIGNVYTLELTKFDDFSKEVWTAVLVVSKKHVIKKYGSTYQIYINSAISGKRKLHGEGVS